MAFEHTETAWSEFLRTVQAGRPPNIKVTGQAIEDNIRETVQLADVSHLAAPLGWNVAGYHLSVTGVAGQYSRIELVCNLPTQILLIQSASDAHLQVADVAALAGHAAPATVFSGVAQNLVIGAASALPAPVAGEFLLNVTTQDFKLSDWPAMPIYVARGKVFRISREVVNAVLIAGLIWREIPVTR